MKFKLLRGDEYEARYWICLMKDIQAGFFQKIRAFVSDTLSPDTWCIPALPILHKKSSHDLLRQCGDTCLTLPQPSTLEKVVTSDLQAWRLLHGIQSDEAQVKVAFSKLQKIERKLFADITSFFDLSTCHIRYIHIIPVTFGTTGTFNINPVGTQLDLYLTYRVDLGIQTIPSTLCNAIVYILRGMKNDEIGSYTDWLVRQRDVDFLASYTFFKKYADILRGTSISMPPTLNQLCLDQTQLTLASLAHYQLLGYPMASLVREIQGTIWVDQVAITGIQALPKKILLYLIKHRGRIVTFDELADVYWGASSDQSSLYTLAKAIQKIRDAFKAHGIHQEIIKTVRKQGYILL